MRGVGRSLFMWLLASALATFGTVAVGSAQTAVVGWGLQVFDSRWKSGPFVELAAGGMHTGG